ncbi:MBL fold metallo-hydrolase [Limosilactobacillus reuteri]|nr:MBL fold metallo-hydrolase [Limosilactobacillus reuteri]
MRKINDNIFQITLKQEENYPNVNIYLLLKEKILIDAGPKPLSSLVQLKKELSSLGLKLDQLNMVILTHHHIDHVGLLEYFPSNLIIIGPDNLNFYSSASYINDIKRIADTKKFSNEFKKDIVQHLKDEIIPSINNSNYYPISTATDILENFNLKIVKLSGHSSEDLIVIDSEGNYFTGDIIIPKIFFNCIYEVKDFGTGSQRVNYYRELEFLLTATNLVFPGHGNILGQKELEKAILVTKKRMKRTEKKVIRELENTSNDEIENVCHNVFESFLPYSKFLPFSEVSSIWQEYRN